MGVPLPGVAITLIDPITGEEADEGEISLDLAQGAPFLMAGYLGVAGTGAATESRFYGTGDVAQRDGDGVITFIGRTDDIFKSSDYKVSPFEVESVLIEHPAVAEAAVVPAPDPTRLNLVKAYVALANGWSADRDTAYAVLKHAREQLPPYERVRRVEFFELPKTISGKIRRVELRQREADAAAAGERLPDEWRDDQFPELKGRG
jgi:acetyl-CoA synthetase